VGRLGYAHDRGIGGIAADRAPVSRGRADPRRCRRRGHAPGYEEADLPAVVEECRDPETMRWSTTIPHPAGGYQLSDAQDFLAAVRAGWQDGTRLTWTVEAERDGSRQFCGAVSLVMGECGLGRDRVRPAPRSPRAAPVISSAVRLVRDYAFDALGLNTLRWRAKAGNWASRRVAAATGFVFDGLVRRLLDDHGELVDGWVATMTRDDPRTPVPLAAAGRVGRVGPGPCDRSLSPTSSGSSRPVPTRGPGTGWSPCPTPTVRADALTYLEATRELAARGTGVVWCVADPDDGRCLGSIGLEGLGTYAPRGEIGYWAHPDARGRGLITAAVKARQRPRPVGRTGQLDHDPVRGGEHRVPVRRGGRGLPPGGRTAGGGAPRGRQSGRPGALHQPVTLLTSGDREILETRP
jgi:RimJ/RimL family protein N-acetyltransferase